MEYDLLTHLEYFPLDEICMDLFSEFSEKRSLKDLLISRLSLKLYDYTSRTIL